MPLSLSRAGLGAKAQRLWASAAFWRYAELAASRGAPLLLHTFLLVAYGASGYAYPAWVLGMVGIAAALLPDTQGYLLVRAHGEGAWRLAKAAVPYVWLKTALALAIGGGAAVLLGSDALRAGAPAGHLGLILAAALLCAAADHLWGFSSQLSLARGTLRRVTLVGAAAKSVGLGGVLALHWAGVASIETDLAVYALPTLLAAALTQPRPTTFRRTWAFNHFALAHYALWAQGVSILTMVLSQAIPQGAGLLPGVSASAVGQLAYAFRWLGVSTVLLQVLQGLVTQANRVAFGRGRGPGGYQALVITARKHPALRPLYLAFRWGGGASAVVGVAGSAGALVAGLIPLGVAISMVVYSVGMGLFSAYRFEHVLALSHRGAKTLLLRGMLPATGVGGLLAAALAGAYGIPGLAVGVALTWCLFAGAWRRVG